MDKLNKLFDEYSLELNKSLKNKDWDMVTYYLDKKKEILIKIKNILQC